MNLVNEVLDISKIDSGKSVVEEEMCSIHEIVDNVCQLLQHEIDNKKLNGFAALRDILTQHYSMNSNENELG